MGWNEEPTQNFRPIGGRLRGEPAFRKNYERLEVTGGILDLNGRRWPATIGLKFCVGTFLGYRNIPSKSHARRTRRLGDASEMRGRRARFVGIWPVLALSEGTSLRHRKIGSYHFSEILYGGRWGGMRNPHKISGQSEVV